MFRCTSPRRESHSSPLLRPACLLERFLENVWKNAKTLFSKVVGIDWSDAGGMNLLDIQTKEWNGDLLAAAGDNLAEKLGAPVSPNTVVGTVSEYMQERSVENQFQLSHRLWIARTSFYG